LRILSLSKAAFNEIKLNALSFKIELLRAFEAKEEVMEIS
jgi:hypothetical protein